MGAYVDTLDIAFPFTNTTTSTTIPRKKKKRKQQRQLARDKHPRDPNTLIYKRSRSSTSYRLATAQIHIFTDTASLRFALYLNTHTYDIPAMAAQLKSIKISSDEDLLVGGQ